MSEAVFDTNILVDHLRDVESATLLIKKVESGAITGYISTATVAELFAGQRAGGREDDMLEALLELFTKVDVNESIAKLGGRFKRDYGMALADGIIGATAVNLNCKLFTLDSKGFSRVKEVDAEKPY